MLKFIKDNKIIDILINKLWRMFLFIAIFVFIYSPIIKFGALKIFTFKLFPPFLFLLSLIYLKKFPRSFLFLFISLILVFSFLCIHYTQTYYKDSTFILRVGIGVLLLNSSLFLFKVFKFTFEGRALNKLIEYIIFSAVLNVIIMTIQVFSKTFREFTDILFEITIFDDRFGFIQRLNGLASSGGAVLSVLMGLSLALIHFKRLKLRDKSWSVLKTVLISILLLFGIIYSGRSGLFLLAFYFVFYFVSNFQLLNIIKYAIMWIFGLQLMLYVLDNYAHKNEYLIALQRTAEIFISLRDEGQLRTSTSDQLQTMYILPSDKPHLFFGDGNFGRQDYLPDVQSDVFYVRVIFGVGVFGLLVLIVPFIIMFIIVFNRKSPLQGFMLFLVLGMIILNFKEVFYFGTTGFTSILFLLISAHLTQDTFCEKSSLIVEDSQSVVYLKK